MSMLPTDPPIIQRKSSEQQSKEKGQRSYEATRRSIGYAIVSAVFGAILIFADGGKLPAIGASFVISGILGIAFARLQGYDQNVRELESLINGTIDMVENLKKQYMAEVTRLSRENTVNEQRVSKLMGEFDDLVQNAAVTLKFYSTIRKLLENGLTQTQLIRSFLDEAMNRPIFTQPMKEGAFFELAKKGIEECTVSWQAIHQGPISNLPPFSYLQQLKVAANPLIKQRIVILNEEECKELEDYHIVDNFLRATDGTDSYWVEQETFFREFDIPIGLSLDDAALHDGKLLILRNRTTQLTMLALKDQGDRACDGIIHAFATLKNDLELKRSGSIFKAIERPKRPDV